MKEIKLESVTKEDLKEIATISVESWKTTYQGIVDQDYLDSLSIEKRYERFLENYTKGPFIVAKIEEKVIGFCRYSTKIKEERKDKFDSELTVLYVDPNYKRQGIGSALFQYVKKELQKENKHHMLICCLKGNKIGENFYTKMGGKIVGTSTTTFGEKEYEELNFLFEI